MCRPEWCNGPSRRQQPEHESRPDAQLRAPEPPEPHWPRRCPARPGNPAYDAKDRRSRARPRRRRMGATIRPAGSACCTASTPTTKRWATTDPACPRSRRSPQCDLDALCRRYPAFRRLLTDANRAAASGDTEAYRALHAAVVAWEPPAETPPELTERERQIHAAFARRSSEL